jgi:hypothetical protein
MSTWMSIGFDPDHMDSATEPNTQAAINGAGDDAAPRRTGRLDQAMPSEGSARWLPKYSGKKVKEAVQ